ncbi:hypothetical protein TNCV_2601491 [Trichonephila clavipes]|nr:hypothetical protein TNCV_2601491 [Trichonephila clavipes]
MVGNVFVRYKVTLFTRSFKEAAMPYRSYLCCHPLQSRVECYANNEMADMHLIRQLAEGNARAFPCANP